MSMIGFGGGSNVGNGTLWDLFKSEKSTKPASTSKDARIAELTQQVSDLQQEVRDLKKQAKKDEKKRSVVIEKKATSTNKKVDKIKSSNSGSSSYKDSWGEGNGLNFM